MAPLSSTGRIEDEQNSIGVFRTAAPATVFVTQNQLVLDRYSLRATETPTGAGSGFLWDELGHLVTNYHVVAGARSLTVTLHDQSVWPAVLVGGDPRKDVAVLKIEPGEKGERISLSLKALANDPWRLFRLRRSSRSPARGCAAKWAGRRCCCRTTARGTSATG